MGIGTTTPAGALDLNPTVTTNFGFVAPRVALTSTILQAPVVNPQGGAITAGTVVYNTATAGTTPNNVGPGLYYWNGAKWIAFAGSPGGLDWSLTGNSGTTAGTNFIGTTDAQDIRFHTNGTERARILSTGTMGINSVGTTTSQLTVAASGTNDAIAGTANHNVANAVWGRNAHATGTAVIGATNGLGGIYPTNGAGIAGSGTNSIGVYGSTGNGSPNNDAHDGNHAGGFTLDSDNNATTANSSATARLAGKEISPARTLYGGYFSSFANSSTNYAYVGVNYNHNNNANANGGTNYKILGNGVVSTIVPDADNKPRIMFAPEAPEVLFQDYGIGNLQNGIATIKLDKILSKNILVDANHPLKVFIQLEGDCNGVFVTDKSAEGFTVKELQNGNSNVTFSWQIVATRADAKDANGNITSHFENLRFPVGPNAIKETSLKTKEIKKEEAQN
ncbi:hypothetical protein FSS13T_02670 [Flavobacterium saliperosum S13]|uniref:Trimeric autotransporter adhesin YadA-like head domain-containing protein n=1 Tax=Flavobacterium saliperosum S13 TaxID=1341155 RepID=A0ABN0QJ41_9FLAO|nr:hypothetical protein FSS13T_02670 [Flavobacterium saliperosum S13]